MVCQNKIYCFACNESSDIIKFVMERDGLNFYEAVDKLADEFGIDTGNDETYKKQISLAEQNGRFIESCLRETDKIRDYLTKKRGFTDEVLTEYKIGYYEKLKAIVIPMVNLYNQPVAFLFRFFDKLPKYKNSKNNELFVKGEFLYNMPNAERLLRKTKRLYLVEGAFDCMSAYQQGEAAVIAYLILCSIGGVTAQYICVQLFVNLSKLPIFLSESFDSLLFSRHKLLRLFIYFFKTSR